MDILKGELMMEMLILEKLKDKQKTLQEKLGSEEYMALRQSRKFLRSKDLLCNEQTTERRSTKIGSCRIISFSGLKIHLQKKRLLQETLYGH